MSRAEKITAIQLELQTFSTHAYLLQQQVAYKMRLYPTDFHSIHLLDRYGEMTAGKLAAHLGLTSGATTAVIDRLVVLGYIERIPSATDRRSIVIRLRADGIQRMRNEYSSIDKQVQNELEQLSDAELKVVEHFMHVLTNS